MLSFLAHIIIIWHICKEYVRKIQGECVCIYECIKMFIHPVIREDKVK